MRGYCRGCDAAVDVDGAWPGACTACGSRVEVHPLPDVVAPNLRVLFVGINPGVQSARLRQHYANPQNAFWWALCEAGFTPTRMHPRDQQALASMGIGLTNAVTRATAGSSDVTAEDIVRGRAHLEALVMTHHPRWLAFVGKESYRMATGIRGAPLGDAGEWHGARVFVLPSTSPRNAAVSRDEKLAWFRALAKAARFSDDA